MPQDILIQANDFFTLTEAAHLLGVSRPTLYNWISRGKLHPVTLGRNRYVLRSEVEALKEKVHD